MYVQWYKIGKQLVYMLRIPGSGSHYLDGENILVNLLDFTAEHVLQSE